MTSRCKRMQKGKPQEAKRHRTNGFAWELPGQVATQALFWTFCPSQDVPPFSGVGLVQLRLLFCQPRPHTALQDDQVVHVDQPPLTARPARGERWVREGLGWEGGMEGWTDGGTEQPGLPDMHHRKSVLSRNNRECWYTLRLSAAR